MDVQKRRIGALTLVLALALFLRLHGLHNPLLDHPGWRQGDTASIARNFATLQYNIFYPQTNYNGPPPNYVELELQIVPFLAASAYKIIGVHEVIGRLISIAFSLGTIVVLALFARRLFASDFAGFAAAAVFAIMPGSFYYGRTFTPDTTMVFFLTLALYLFERFLVEDEVWTWRAAGAPAIALAFAILAKPVAIVALVPILAMVVARARVGRTLNSSILTAAIVVPCGAYLMYDRIVSAHAEWHWASGITSKHVLPALAHAFTSPGAFHAKFTQFHQVLDLLVHNMIGPILTGIAIAGLLFMPAATRSRSLLWAWLIGGLLYVFAVVTVERVDYYMYLLLPLAALTAGGYASRLFDAVYESTVEDIFKFGCALVAASVFVALILQGRAIAAPYYKYSKAVYRNAVALNRVLDKNTLIVMGHYDPSVLYYIGHYGWEEDPYLWTPFDEQSAIKKGARYFVDIEHNRFARNLELCAWMQRFPLLPTRAQWPVYRTDPALVHPDAEKQWRSFRDAEARGAGRAWLTSHHVCLTKR